MKPLAKNGALRVRVQVWLGYTFWLQTVGVVTSGRPAVDDIENSTGTLTSNGADIQLITRPVAKDPMNRTLTSRLHLHPSQSRPFERLAEVNPWDVRASL